MIDVLETMLMSYAAGGLPAQESLMVAALTALNPTARKKVQHYEALAGRMMCEQEPAAMTSDCLAKLMGRIDAPDAPAPVAPTPVRTVEPPADLGIPMAVQALITRFCMEDRRCWDKVFRGATKMEIRICQKPTRKRLRLLRLNPGQMTPPHGHQGVEMTLVIDGSYSDATGTFNRGDIVILTDPRFIHQPKAGQQGCVCLTLTEAPLRFTDPLTRLMNALWRI
jgi:putative transcriptional regulator